MKRLFRVIAAVLMIAILLSGCDLSDFSMESKNGDAAKRPNTIENYDLKVFLLEQDDQAKENLYALYYAISHFEEDCYLPYPVPAAFLTSKNSPPQWKTTAAVRSCFRWI